MSLTKTAKTFRTGVKVLLVVMVIYYIAILVVFPAGKDFFLNLFVDRNPPKPKYGLLDPLLFQPALTKGKAPTIVLNTKDGRLPAGLPKKMTVYKFKGIQYSYLAGKGAQLDADKLGFSESELISDLKGKEYQWRSLESGGTLMINTETRALFLNTNIQNKSKEYPDGKLNHTNAKEIAERILSRLGRYNSDIYKPENFRVTFAEYGGIRLRETKTPADAQLARVDLFGMIDNYPILGPNAKTGLVWLMLRVSSDEISPYNYPNIEIHHWELNKDKDASYPIISISEAWKEIVAGKGIISDITPKNANPFEPKVAVPMEKVLINKMYLAYYETPEFERYLQPIYVFEGSYTYVGTEGGSITIYYPAITSQYTSKIAPIMPVEEDTPQTSESSPSITN